MTVYNREQYLATAIEGMLSQTRRDFELLICNDGFNDRSFYIICIG
ncbi:MAG: glycosyltransferase [Nostoc sp.]